MRDNRMDMDAYQDRRDLGGIVYIPGRVLTCDVDLVII